MNRCRICGRDLKKEEAQFGDDCQRTFNDALQIIETTPEEVGALFLTGDSTVQRWLRSMTTALIRSLKGRGTAAALDRRCAKAFIEAARKAAAEVTDESVALLAIETEGGAR